MAAERAGTIAQLMVRLLGRGYDNAARQVLAVVAGVVTTGIVEQRLRELDDEAARLAENNQKLSPDNPVMRALLADLADRLAAAAFQVDQAAADIQAVGAAVGGQLTRQLALPGWSDEALRLAGVSWTLPDPEALNALVNFVQSEGWAQEIGRFPGLVLETVQNQAIMGFVEGWGPLRAAREIRSMTEGYAPFQANNLLRTLYLQSSRTGTAITQEANRDILVGQVRMAVLDDQTCLSCIAQMGDVLPIGVRIDDHHQGRCFPVSLVKGIERTFTSGEDWFFSLPEERQLAIAGPGKLEALKTGRATLRDFVEEYEDATFGRMLREASLSGVLLNRN